MPKDLSHASDAVRRRNAELFSELEAPPAPTQKPKSAPAEREVDKDSLLLLRGRIALPIDLDNGNEGRTKHYGRLAKLRTKYEELIRKMYGQETPYPYPVRLTVTRVLGKGQRLWDFDSVLRGSYKELQDALVACGFFVDDSPAYITQVLGKQDANNRHLGPCVEIEIKEVADHV